jgi:2-keto-4-pentenoate hydratase/2-oxohepta-3-ene-1,7-dioic acid hydratase in catechol pathway
LKTARQIVVLAAGVLGALVVAALGVSLAVSRPLFDERLDPARLDRIAIAPPEVALTLAVGPVDGRSHVLVVTRYEGGQVTGVAQEGTDALRLYREQGHDALLALASSAETVTVDATTLDVPFMAVERNIGVGLNYPEHARESSLEEQPFLFPKVAQPTRWTSDIARGDSGLLDYEAEIGLVALDDIERAAPPRLGFVLANEVTDRWALVRNLDRSQPMGTTGFADGKSREGFAPVGALLVIPRDARAFYRQLELELYVNGRLRQREKADAMLWSPERIVSEVFRRAGWPFAWGGDTVRLLPGAGAQIPAGTILFSGTPAGVIFRPLNLWNPWVYLRPGDEVVVRAELLGVIRNRITR